MMGNDILTLNGEPITTRHIVNIARHGQKVKLSKNCIENLRSTRKLLDQKVAGQLPYYGINTGFGALGKISIGHDSLHSLQQNLIRSHAAGVGQNLSREVVRSVMAVLSASLCRGHSGVKAETILVLLELLNHDLTPSIPETGSVGASGDLAALSHIALSVIGEGTLSDRDGKILPSHKAMQRVGIVPVVLEAKEGLALINGTHLMAGRGALLVEDFQTVFTASLFATAMSIDACRTTPNSLDPRIHRLRRNNGQIKVAERILTYLHGSQIARSHQGDDPRVQDPYSFRCCPAVLGAAWEAFGYFRTAITNELGAVTDNPLLFEENSDLEILSGGNFHGMPIAIPLDVLAISIAHLAGITERRVFHMLSGIDPEARLPTFMTPQAGLQSGLMIVQYTAAACCNEIIGLANPASVANLSTSAGMEDYNSFGPRSAAKATRCLDLAKSVVSIELLCASNGIEHHRPLRSSQSIENGLSILRTKVTPLVEDRSPSNDIAEIEKLISEDSFQLHPLS
nr:histidine ammonia-lyase [Mariniblastus sp.]